MTERELFVAALAIEPGDRRKAYLDSACGDRPDLRGRLDELLRAHDGSGDFLKDGIVAPVGSAGFPTPTSDNGQSTPFPGAASPVTDLAGGRMVAGRYRLLADIGAGGMGHVWSAEQLHPVRRVVAIKLIKAGMDTRQVLARFEAERQALALMDHPNIARVFDGGMTETGRPFFVMELVRGTPITTFCDVHRLGIADRLRLFVPVCQAVHHAHQKGIIHRDLKPSNILVTDENGAATPKIIDFGLAKALQGPPLLADGTFHTAAGTIVGTPIYMAPEQTRAGMIDTDTRTDVFTLGVILYELLTGRTPITKAQLRGLDWDQICRLIRESEPVRPSEHQRSLRGDLDWIVLKALAKDRDRRYESAAALAADLQHYLADEPVSASPPRTANRIAKYLRRHRGPVLAASLVFLTLVAGLIGTSWSLRRAEQAAAAERDAKMLAQQRLTQVESANEILETMFQALDPQAEKLDGQTFTEFLTQRVRETAAKLEQAPIDDLETVARLQNSIGCALLGLSDHPAAIRFLTRASHAFHELYGADDRRTLMCRNNLGRALDEAGRVHEALAEFRDTHARLATLFGADDHDTLTASLNLGMAHLRALRFDDALPLLTAVYETRKTGLGPEAQPTQVAASSLASVYNGLEQYQRALDLLLPIYGKRIAALGAEHPRTVATLETMAQSYRGLGNKSQCVSCLERALAGRKSVQGVDHVESLKCAANLASAYKNAGQLDKALPLYEQTLPKLQTKLGPDHPEAMTALNNFAMAHWVSGRLDQSIPLFEQLVDLTVRKLGPDHANAIKAIGNLGVNYRDAGRFDDAVAKLEEAHRRIQRLPISSQVPQNFIPCALADTLDRMGRFEQSVPVHRKAVDLTRRRDGDDHGNTRVEVARLATSLLLTKQYREAERLARECLERSERLDPNHWLTFCVQVILGASLAGQGRHTEAEPIIAGGYAGLSERQEKIAPKFRKLWFTMLLESLVQVADAANRPDDAAKWRPELARWQASKP